MPDKPPILLCRPWAALQRPWLILAFLALGPTAGRLCVVHHGAALPARTHPASIVVMLEAPVSVLLAVALLGERLR
ncbi:MAG: hypothetical protein U0074_02785 [Kouleothrix sp.]